MKILTLKRICELSDCTYGVLFDEKEPFCLTLEETWKNNKADSCIPRGEYICKRSHYNKGDYPTFEIICPPRSNILFHKGNTSGDTLGCILPGTQFGNLAGLHAVTGSGAAFTALMLKLGGQTECKLVIE